jgi:hypothetical protein
MKNTGLSPKIIMHLEDGGEKERHEDEGAQY